MHDHCIEMTNLATRLRNLEISLDNSFLVQFILNSLSPQYIHFQIHYNALRKSGRDWRANWSKRKVG
ncbi:unnamed protein product [Linum tenue]|uniref:Uncharacterized protein n=1 Tax=Linum tenue TaxID=586396 RepID=A0AAV0QTU2_9ROSI|nr:unnamed protein product [Linum tenue]